MEQIKGEPIRNSFIFYRSFLDALNRLADNEQFAMYKAIATYALNGVEPQLTGVCEMMWDFIKPILDANWRKYRNGCKGAPHGIKGGAPEGNQNAKNKKEEDIFPKIPKQPLNNP